MKDVEHGETVTPLGVDEVLRAEHESLRTPGDEAPPPLSALCISGGGIRSATFGLGAIQGLASAGLLPQFDYLSTVSGGGYIGSWLSAWSKRSGGVKSVTRSLASETRSPVRTGPDPIDHLREYNRYLAPVAGALSADLWTLVAGVVRNIILNWIVLIPLLLAALFVPRIYLSLLSYPQRQFGHVIFQPGMPPNWAAPELNVICDSPVVTQWLPGISFVLFTVGLFNTLRYLPGVGGIKHTRARYNAAILAPIFGAVLTYLAFESLRFVGHKFKDYTHALGLVLWIAAPCGCAWLLYFVVDRRPLRARVSATFGPLPGAILAMAAGTAISTWTTTNFLVWDLNTARELSWTVYVTVGPPAVLLGFGLGMVLFAGVSSRVLKDEDREWLSRSSAGVLLACVAWAALCSVVLILPAVALSWRTWGAGVIAVGGVASALLSRIPLPGAANANPESEGRLSPAVVRAAVTLAPFVFIALLAIALSIFSNVLLDWWRGTYGPRGERVEWYEHTAFVSGTQLTYLVVQSVALFLTSWAMARNIDINTFSLHGMYRDRLIRAYLGASNPVRRPNPFTDFDAGDDLPISSLAAVRPFHIVNVTLNLVNSGRLSRQERKAASFTMTPLHCGSAELGYRDSAHYGGAISLGTAVALSGAAASPNMGHYSSPLVGFIMTLFNARLGSWLGNPGPAGERTWRDAGPRKVVGLLLSEAFGLTSDRSKYVYLSDGGHFENLGLYEVVRRRCRTVLVVDSGCDPEFSLGDLGNALRKIRIDFGVSIAFDEVALHELAERKRRWAAATIRYSAVDPSVPDGVLIYVKPMLLGTEPPDVRSYAAANPAFPHQSTADQSFDESQTESYRQLGLTTIADVCGEWKSGAIAELFSRLHAGEPASVAERTRSISGFEGLGEAVHS